MKNDWNPELYLKFDKERTQPSIDLVSRIESENPKKIIDIGCGPGNSTQILVSRWPTSNIIGLDNSITMIEKAKKDYPWQEWKLLDAGKNKIEGKYDIVFSNATIQWIPNHKDLLKKFHSILTENGIMAIQIPLFWDMPVGKALISIANDKHWADIAKDVLELFSIHNSSFYYDILTELFQSIDMWETNYIHILDSHQSVLEMIRGAGLRPFLERLESDSERKIFSDRVLEEIIRDYPSQKDGKVLFPFTRLFFIGKLINPKSL
jgi:trans-aconitate 2-methyltransferase